MKFNVIYTNSGPRTPSGKTENQTIASLAKVGVYFNSVPLAKRTALPGNPDAASVIKSNGEGIGNAQLPNNPLPPGITS